MTNEEELETAMMDALTTGIGVLRIDPNDMLKSTESLISERHKTHGAFTDHARITQSLKRVIRNELYHRHTRGQPPLTDTQYEAVDMILHKIGRIVAGDSAFQDHYDDIAGYAKIANGQV